MSNVHQVHCEEPDCDDCCSARPPRRTSFAPSCASAHPVDARRAGARSGSGRGRTDCEHELLPRLRGDLHRRGHRLHGGAVRRSPAAIRGRRGTATPRHERPRQQESDREAELARVRRVEVLSLLREELGRVPDQMVPRQQRNNLPYDIMTDILWRSLPLRPENCAGYQGPRPLAEDRQRIRSASAADRR